MALTIIFALLAALLLSLTVVPALCVYLLRAAPNHREPWLVRRAARGLRPLLDWALSNPLKVGAGAIAGMVVAGLAFTQIGSTFMPVMDEGTPVIIAAQVSRPSASRKRRRRTCASSAPSWRRVPEVRGIMGRAGADELGIDPVGLNETDMFLDLAPKKDWRRPDTAWLIGELRSVLDGIPGISYAFSQPIDMRVQETDHRRARRRGGEGVRPRHRRAEPHRARDRRGDPRHPGLGRRLALRNEGMKYLTVRADRLAAGRLGINAERRCSRRCASGWTASSSASCWKANGASR